MVESNGLENRSLFTRTRGSNPLLSAYKIHPNQYVIYRSKDEGFQGTLIPMTQSAFRDESSTLRLRFAEAPKGKGEPR